MKLTQTDGIPILIATIKQLTFMRKFKYTEVYVYTHVAGIRYTIHRLPAALPNKWAFSQLMTQHSLTSILSLWQILEI